MRKIILFLSLCIFQVAAYAQSALKGLVQSEEGTPLAGVSVSNETRKSSTKSNAQGEFSISAQVGDVLKVSSVGYSDYKTSVLNLTPLKIVLTSKDQELEEVVVVGYGTVKKSNITGSVSRLDKKVLETGVRSNPASALAGTIPGLRVQQTSGKPGAVPNIVLRGGTSYDGSGSPLVIVDGLIRSGFQDINQDDIESIDVLKDASATAIYGARASNGVVLITTKRGKSGTSNITLRSKTGINKLNIPLEFLGAEDYISWSRKAVQTSGIYNPSVLNQLTAIGPFGTGNRYKDANGNILDGNKTGNAVWSTMFLDDTNRELLNQGWKTMIDPITGKELIFTEFDYSDYALRKTPVTQDYNLSFTGGNDKGTYYSSVGKYYEQGSPVGTNYDRLTFVLNGDYKIKPWLTSSSGLNFANTKWKDVANTSQERYMSRVLGAPPTMRGYNSNGELLLGRDYTDGNPLVNLDKFIRNNLNQKFTLSQALQIKFTDDLNLRASGNWYINQALTESFNKDYLSSPGNVNSTRSTSAAYDKTFNQTYNAVLNYSKLIANKHNVSAMLGWEFFDSYGQGLSASGQGAPTDDFLDLGLTQDGKGLRAIDSHHTRQRINSFFGRMIYDYDSRYMLTLTARHDGYSTLLNNRWGTFPGVSLGWNIHNEEFAQDFIGSDKVVNTLKLRAGYGKNGDVGFITSNGRGNYFLQGAYGTSKYDGNVGYRMTSLSVPDLKWESLVTKEIGFDARLINKIDVGFTYYNRTTSDKIAILQLPASAGFTSITTNNGDMQNQGLELDLRYNIVRKTDWGMNFQWNTAYNANKILKLPYNGVERNRQNGIQVYDATTKELTWVGGYQEGQDPNVAYAFEAIGIIRTQEDLDNYALKLRDVMGARTLVHPDVYEAMSEKEKEGYYAIALGDVMWRDVNEDGVINSYDRVYQGRTVPRWTGGFGLDGRWKNFSLSARFDYALGFVAYDGPRAWFSSNAQGTFNTTTDVFDSWSPENPNGSMPTYYWADQNFKRNTYRESSMFYNKGDYLAFRELSLAYKLPSSLAQRIKMEGFQVSLTGQNLYYWTKNTLFSAESGSMTSADGSGGYPLPRTFILGVQLTF